MVGRHKQNISDRVDGLSGSGSASNPHTMTSNPPASTWPVAQPPFHAAYSYAYGFPAGAGFGSGAPQPQPQQRQPQPSPAMQDPSAGAGVGTDMCWGFPATGPVPFGSLLYGAPATAGFGVGAPRDPSFPRATASASSAASFEPSNAADFNAVDAAGEAPQSPQSPQRPRELPLDLAALLAAFFEKNQRPTQADIDNFARDFKVDSEVCGRASLSGFQQGRPGLRTHAPRTHKGLVPRDSAGGLGGVSASNHVPFSPWLFFASIILLALPWRAPEKKSASPNGSNVDATRTININTSLPTMLQKGHL